MGPEIIIVLTGILVILEDGKGVLQYAPTIGLVAALFSTMLVSSPYAVFFKIAIIGLSLLIVLISIPARSEYFAFILFAAVGMMVMAGSMDLITIYVGLELMAISIYVLVGISRTEPLSNEAAVKYFLLGLLATAFLLYGISFAYGFFGTTDLVLIRDVLQNSGVGNSGYILAMIFLAVAFGFKIAAVPFHMWTPDAYQGATTPVAAFMSVGPKLAAFAVLGRVFIYSLSALKAEWTIFFTVISLLTMTVGNVVAIAQTNMKRMLAYSSIAHAGYCLIGIASNDMASVLFYLSGYLFMNVGVFSVIIFLDKNGISGPELDDFSGLNELYPGIALLASVFLLSLAGVPPTAGFVGKFYVFMAAVKSNYILLAVAGVLNSVIALYYYLRIIVYMYMRPAYGGQEGDLGTGRLGEVNRSETLLLVLGIAVIAVLIIGIYPESIMRFIYEAIK